MELVTTRGIGERPNKQQTARPRKAGAGRFSASVCALALLAGYKTLHRSGFFGFFHFLFSNRLLHNPLSFTAGPFSFDHFFDAVNGVNNS